jgi:hypothetical protein
LLLRCVGGKGVVLVVVVVVMVLLQLLLRRWVLADAARTLVARSFVALLSGENGRKECREFAPWVSSPAYIPRNARADGTHVR